MNQLYKQRKAQGLEVLVSFDVPTMEGCQAAADQLGINRAKVIFDPGNELLFGAVSSAGFALPWDGVLDGRTMEYVWNATQPGTPQEVVDGLLAE